MVEKIEQSQEELQCQLINQLKLLEISADSFDNGYDIEAINMAVRIRVLLNDTKSQKSLLGQLGLKNNLFLSTCPQHDPDSLISFKGLVNTFLGNRDTRLIALLDDSNIVNYIPFDEWWNEIVFIDQGKTKLSRKDIVLTLTDQDGGAHVDPTLDSAYARLSRCNSMGLFKGNENNWMAMQHPERTAIRQIAHEVLKSLKPEYKKKPNTMEDGYIIGDAKIIIEDLPVYKKVGRNDPCPCGSGKKYKKCHGK